MTEISVNEIAKATGGRLVGDGNVRVSSLTTDSRQARHDGIFAALRGERFDGNDFLEPLDTRVGCAICEREAEVSYPIVVTDDSLKALGDLARYYIKEKTSPKVTVALTGSVGKTTTKEMVSSVLGSAYKTAYTKGNFNNHIGVPLTLLSADPDVEALVVEMGMNHRGELEYLTGLVESDIALITNIGHSHIENLGSREGIRDAKLEILGGVKKGGAVILNGDEPLLRGVEFDGKIIRVGMSNDCDVRAESIEMTEERIEFDLTAFGKRARITLPCTGRHNVMNSLFAIAVGLIMKLDLDKIQSGLLNYKSVGNRQNIYTKNGVKVIADCYNAGIESMSASVTLLSELPTSGRRIAVLADMLELGEISESAHREVGRRISECGIDILLCYGEHSRAMYESALSLGVTAYHLSDREALAAKLGEIVGRGDTVLFKASHSMKLEEVIALAGLE